MRTDDDARLAAHVRRMRDTPVSDWWRFVPCSTCNNTHRGDPCRWGGSRWGEERPPHAARRRAAWLVLGTLWLLRNYPEDLLLSGNPR